MRKFLMVLMFSFGILLAGCTSESHSRHALESAGFTDIEFTGYQFFSCGEDDTLHTGFRATNPTGQRVEGTVCCGLVIKDCTIRF